jgi:hypothetical protein
MIDLQSKDGATTQKEKKGWSGEGVEEHQEEDSPIVGKRYLGEGWMVTLARVTKSTRYVACCIVFSTHRSKLQAYIHYYHFRCNIRYKAYIALSSFRSLAHARHYSSTNSSAWKQGIILKSKLFMQALPNKQ